MVTPKVSPKKLSDIVEYSLNNSFTTISGSVTTPTLDAVSLADGMATPLKLVSGTSYVVLQGTDEANADAFLWEQGPLEIPVDGDVFNKCIFVNGPALVKFDNFPTVDYEGTAFTLSTLITAYAALDIKEISTPAKTSTQTQ